MEVPSYQPLVNLHACLASGRNTSSIYETIRSFNHCWKCLPETAKANTVTESSDIVTTTSTLVKSIYTSLLDLISENSHAPAIVDAISQRSLSHRSIFTFVRDFQLPISHTTLGSSLVALAIPNGSLLALLSLAVASKYTLVPLAATSGPEQFRRDVLQSGVKAVVVLREDVHKLGLDDAWVAASGIEVCTVVPRPDLTCSVLPTRHARAHSTSRREFNRPDDICLILFTSGTTGNRKLVPITLHAIISGVAFVEDSWALKRNDVCLNMMPLNHVGGLVRNLFAPILLGGSTICCPAFDPNMFWDLVETQGPTWYYASPSMHSAILGEVADRRTALNSSRIRMVCNAAAGLLPSLASQLRDTFQCTVLPSYGMTECMPISTPPLDYRLERPGTSGVSVGPEIAILDATDRKTGIGMTGRVCVRGSPVFPGYLKDGRIETSAFTSDGWFDTGDLGYMDVDGYLYLTGRSKEVINRGGELISPFEVEEAIMAATNERESLLFQRVSDCLAFSVPHSTLQEAVGVVLVPSPNKPRPDTRQLHEALKVSLHQTKLPIVVVYMEAIPKRNGKPVRIKLGERLGFLPITDNQTLAERHILAYCPPADAPLTVHISNTQCSMDRQKLIGAIDACCEGMGDISANLNSNSRLFDVVIAPKMVRWASQKLEAGDLKAQLRRVLDGYLIPDKIVILDAPFPRNSIGAADPPRLSTFFHSRTHSRTGSQSTFLERKVRQIFADTLSLSVHDIAANADFFDIGGDSLRAGRLLSALRRELSVSIPINQLFTGSKVSDICIAVNAQRLLAKEEGTMRATTPLPQVESKTYSSTRKILLLIQLLPLAVFLPIKKAFFWTIFLASWALVLVRLPHIPLVPFAGLLFSIFAGLAALQIVLPLLSFIIKWSLIGTYKEGLYPMWSAYHTRWWFVQKITNMCGMGMFKHFNCSRIWYHRLMGAKIGNGVSIEASTVMGEHDLICIEDGVELDRCIVRPFAAEQNTTMYLGKIRIGKNCSIGLKTVIAPGTHLPEDTCLGSNSSSWEWEDANESNRDQLSMRIPEAHWLLWIPLGLPILAFVKVTSLLPWFAGLQGLNTKHLPVGADPLLFLVAWFANSKRVGFHFLARLLHTCLGPAVFLAVTAGLAAGLRLVFGKFRPGSAATRSNMDRFRTMLMSRLIPNGDISEVSNWFGTHYEITSWIVRQLGGSVGKRVYWPGNGPHIQNFELIDIGDDVVFGSRSYIVTSDGTGCDYVRIGNGAMVADRVILQPGTEVGDQAVLGSGTLTRRNAVYEPGSTWIGSRAGGPIFLSSSKTTPPAASPPTKSHSRDVKNLRLPPSPIRSSFEFARTTSSATPFLSDEKGASSSTSSTTPFGRAFYEGQAPYNVHGLPTIFAYSFVTNIFCAIYWNVPTILGLQVLYRFAVHDSSPLSPLFAPSSSLRWIYVFVGLTVSLSVFYTIFSIIALAICVAAKWIIIGRREAGSLDWDKSDYCQRWQLLLTVERIRRARGDGEDILTQLTGTAWLATYYRLLGATIGKDCALFAGGQLTLPFTEPELLTLGDRVSVDDASLVAHINSRGHFNLNPLVVGDRSVLRTGSRLLSGASMGKDCCLLEHTLVMAGEEIEDGATYQGWPSEPFRRERIQLENNEEEEEEMEKEGADTASTSDIASSKGTQRKLGLWRRFWFARSKGYERISEQDGVV
jgi:acyl-CoA synthetase (AMP-forming)/AMP-acid ligase II/acetyltransferase-like isoleucine patch superfamily enzyme/acyl carrier protein